MINQALKKDAQDLLKESKRLVKYYKGDTSDASIEIELQDPISYETYPYYGNKTNRDSDFDELSKILKDVKTKK